MKFPILSKNSSLNIDNDNYTLEQLSEKLEIEQKELNKAIMEDRNKGVIAEELFDTIQTCIGMLNKLSEDGIDMRYLALKHEKKLIKLGWRWRGYIEFKTMIMERNLKK
ncbi:hypothetical protein CPAST_c27970 [Clostridium pasteurianum DSM 525 = ATCC 6013]|uniref:Uncharacterized protein n=1 Tax=Clostridium pasteurianum DSM 525 = ATCC 6013 TaxID=1262449 RepID=A0A0H3J5Y3_CLOPA|nr:hypothetical protein [Clostridium pasteurianum]AJA48864.1 hypothetical protein CPAST_c27970 [Clostridium pasteurianum DSM 525 = ATCC 6013]AJA52852.1 hypothetical protein CLPA_c27970 [Clostridium pasteurianum DSM 525 = ATCC 6013]AOZ76076.1 hypothetical protein AQ983_13585 [Clostridium pasteurianum DSM 525 = ATCC 6013]AOZ79872.1 hypothetical protein AQ984_13580 [Clostridium pasteurianum]ELP60160.1 hypothetical protein F502_05972 [Clostridium pasteurianum DSM 525 = ATCC 6013]